MFPKRTVKSFVRRQGRLTQSQQTALDSLWSSYGITFTPGVMIEPEKHFSSPTVPLIVDVGFGNGISLLEMAANNPSQNFIGIEVYQAGAGQLIRQLEALKLNNVKVIIHDAVDVLTSFKQNAIDRIQIYFPDPWPKKRHHKRRLIQTAFVEILATALKVGGQIHCATDWAPYATHMLTVLNSVEQLKNDSLAGDFISRPSYRPETKFEARGKFLGHAIHDLLFTKTHV